MSVIESTPRIKPDATIADVRRAIEPCEAGPLDFGDPTLWPAWTADLGATAPTIADLVAAGVLPVFTLGPDDVEDAPQPRRDGPTLTLVEWAELQVDRYRGLGTEAGMLVADHLSDLVAEISILDARTPDAVYDRRAAMAGRPLDMMA